VGQGGTRWDRGGGMSGGSVGWIILACNSMHWCDWLTNGCVDSSVRLGCRGELGLRRLVLQKRVDVKGGVGWNRSGMSDGSVRWPAATGGVRGLQSTASL
jgi:hypothetical protein